jgi:hypothetical protein
MEVVITLELLLFMISAAFVDKGSVPSFPYP